MPHWFTREELYELVWSEPMNRLASQYNISNVGLSKACRRHHIPVPERGYWAKLKANKNVTRRPLPPRGPGMFDHVVIGARNNWSHRRTLSDTEILEAVLEPPIFPKELEDVIFEVRELVGRLSVPRVMQRPHRLIAKLLEADDERRQKAAKEQYLPSWDRPQFDSPFEKRRLRLLNSIFTALERCGMKPSVRGREARELGVQVNDTHVSFIVDDACAKLDHHPSGYQRCTNPSGKMKVAIKWWRSEGNVRRVWEDAPSVPVEKSITDIVVELIVAGEQQYREGTQYSYEWTVERKTRLIEDARRQREEAERKERERLARLQQERIDQLIADADALRRAQAIRAYVREVKGLCVSSVQSIDEASLHSWEIWALAEADRIDPVISGKFRECMKISIE